ncbi:Hypothetical protein HVIM_03727 [Roseomonas mucosa]|nr:MULTISPECIES: hypothetical protein [Roseomonas]MBS5902750.1 hypothetical protein [Acetobacteraceae bacterium]MCG7358687.1 hypothetical protein [Roseomonas mucosa]MDT8288534.1 hypothetical protein [Roseomonas mucosa]MDT8314207.1 hypothetical protein [Roseomonas mucosa]MDT8349712.1 hypothetical protein [Roseomonas mucosa]
MELRDFRRRLETHGAGLARWPEGEAVAARALLAASAEARALLAETLRLDVALDATPGGAALPPDPEALARMRAAVAARVARMPAPALSPALSPAASPGMGGRLRAWFRPLLPAGCGALAMLALCAVWLAISPPSLSLPGSSGLDDDNALISATQVLALLDTDS